MSNMSYCRFRNTLEDLRDCQEALGEGVLDGALSKEEESAAKELIRVCSEIHEDFVEELP